MGFLVALIVIGSLVALGMELRRATLGEGWREQTEGLRERWEHHDAIP